MANEYYSFRHEDSEFCYDSENLRLMKGATEIELEKTPREVLAHLLKNPGKLIRYEDLKAKIWQQPYMDNASVYNAINKINKALRDAQPGADFIRTRKGEGVVFKAKVEVLPGPPPHGPPSPTDSNVDGAKSAAHHSRASSESGVDLGGAIKAAAESRASSIADRLCAEIQEIVAAHRDRESAIRSIRLHLETELEDTEEWLASSRQGAEEQKTKKRDTQGEVAAFAFSNIFYARELADAKRKKRALSMMLGELQSISSGPLGSHEIAPELSRLARFYLR